MKKLSLLCLSMLILAATLVPSQVLAADKNQLSTSSTRKSPRLLKKAVKLQKMADRLARKAGVAQKTISISVPGDFNQDGNIDDVDQMFLQFCLMTGTLIEICQPADLNCDSVINLTDVAVFAGQRFSPGSTTPVVAGDLDRDCDVDSVDVEIFRACYYSNYTESITPELCQAADMNQDGVVNLSDVALMASAVHGAS